MEDIEKRQISEGLSHWSVTGLHVTGYKFEVGREKPKVFPESRISMLPIYRVFALVMLVLLIPGITPGGVHGSGSSALLPVVSIPTAIGATGRINLLHLLSMYLLSL